MGLSHKMGPKLRGGWHRLHWRNLLDASSRGVESFVQFLVTRGVWCFIHSSPSGRCVAANCDVVWVVGDGVRNILALSPKPFL